MKAEPFNGDADQLSAVVKDWAFKPYRWAAVSADALLGLTLSRLRRRVEGDGVRTWIVRGGNGPTGLATLEPLPWDSRMLGVRAARAEFIVSGEYQPRRHTFEALLAAALHESRTAGFAHLSVRVDAGDDAAIHALESAGFLSVDALLTFERRVQVDSPRENAQDLLLREARAADTDAIGQLAAASLVDGRFHTDPSVDADTAAAIYGEWARSCCRGTAADGVLVAATGADEIVGFVACRLHPDTGEYLGRLTASIVLVATAAAARRRGVGRAVVIAALEWAAARSADFMQVGTQIRNAGAARLYERCGFRLAEGSQSFRMVISR